MNESDAEYLATHQDCELEHRGCERESVHVLEDRAVCVSCLRAQLEADDALLTQLKPSPEHDNSSKWQHFRPDTHWSLFVGIQRQFERGAIGHRFQRPLRRVEEEALVYAMNAHPSWIFRNDGSRGGAAIGAILCPCETCTGNLAMFVIHTGINLIAQEAGTDSLIRQDENSVELRTRQISAPEEESLKRAASVASQVAANMCAEMIQKVLAQQVRSQVSAQMAAFKKEMLKQVSAEARTHRQFLIAESFRQQAENDREYYGGDRGND